MSCTERFLYCSNDLKIVMENLSIEKSVKNEIYAHFHGRLVGILCATFATGMYCKAFCLETLYCFKSMLQHKRQDLTRNYYTNKKIRCTQRNHIGYMHWI